ncbi:zinc ribbon domain-containing protein [Bacillus luteolus]|uniref:Zinc ribbon domain-containing protein n=1 Tax=Litchfieldia luteola TaxID=682179 RepID=A0ABR9QER1_9BACI|nr:zinc ribbon domain-containing protein [Cytobacillus luteolus]MBE4906960.1 zinc ribbon domain-containing protein [Cytobacillus luteolus]MBP1943574.1 ribosomal protein L40E [Cytobacillus luteolus]
MRENNKHFVTKEHTHARTFFRVTGPLFLLIGVICFGIAGYDFFTVDMFGEPKYFWLFFVGMSFIFVGLVLSGLGYGGKVAKYQSREYAPVAKDTFNYLAKETKLGVQEIASGVKSEKQVNSEIICQSCNTSNDENANFCDECGGKLKKTCLSCGDNNQLDAKYCDNCGTRLEE